MSFPKNFTHVIMANINVSQFCVIDFDIYCTVKHYIHAIICNARKLTHKNVS